MTNEKPRVFGVHDLPEELSEDQLRDANSQIEQLIELLNQTKNLTDRQKEEIGKRWAFQTEGGGIDHMYGAYKSEVEGGMYHHSFEQYMLELYGHGANHVLRQPDGPPLSDHPFLKEIEGWIRSKFNKFKMN